jgi:hypothetical protein
MRKKPVQKERGRAARFRVLFALTRLANWKRPRSNPNAPVQILVFQPLTQSETHLEWESRLEIRVAWSVAPFFSQVPLQITRSPSLTWLASMSLTFLLPCS